MKFIRFFYRFILIFITTLIMAPLQSVFILILPRNFILSRFMPVWYFRVVLRILSIKVRPHGKFPPPRGTLLICNHVSWLDVLLLASVTPMAFIAKSDFKSWPILGWLSKLNRTIFVERTPSKRTMTSRNEIGTHLARGERIMLFPEGTTGNGTRLLPFKNFFFSAALNTPADIKQSPAHVQPVSLIYAEYYGLKMGRRKRADYAWLGEETFLETLWHIFIAGPLTADIIFHNKILAHDINDRRALSTLCYKHIQNGVAQAVTCGAIHIAE